MQNNKKGFSAIAAILTVLVIGILGFAGWKVYSDDKDSKQSTNDTAQVTLKEHIDTSNTFAFKYPSSWSLVPYEAPGHDSPARPKPDWTKTPQPITLRNQNNKNAEIVINGYKDVSTTIDQEIETIIKDQFNTYSKVTINDCEALKHVLDFVGPSAAEKYKDTIYTVLQGNNKITLQFRERYSNATTNGENNFNATDLSSDFEAVVNSTKFLN